LNLTPAATTADTRVQARCAAQIARQRAYLAQVDRIVTNHHQEGNPK
jgi:hypothetical protein